LLAGVALLLTGCQVKEVALVDGERALAATVGMPEVLLLEIKRAGHNLRQVETMDDDGNPRKGAGVTIDIPHGEALGAVRRLQNGLPPGHYAFVSERKYGFGGDPDEVSVMKAADPFEILRAMGTNGWNYDLSPEMVIARLKEWDGRYGLVFRGIAFDWVEAEFKTQPQDMVGFAKEVYAFCPDVVDQGTESVEVLAKEMKSSNILYLWWD
jgi:hypothetical protein